MVGRIRLAVGREMAGRGHCIVAIRDFPSDLGDLPEDERCWLENLSVQLIVPITGTRDRLVVG